MSTAHQNARHRDPFRVSVGESSQRTTGRHAAWTTIQNPTPEELEELFGDAS